MKEKRRIKRSKAEKVVFTIMFIWLSIYALTFLIAYAITIINTFKDPIEYALGNTYKLPKIWKFDNYANVLDTLVVNNTGYFMMIFNSIWQAILETVPMIIITAMTAYAYARYKFPGRKVLYMIAIILLTLSLPGSLPAMYKLISDMNLRNTPLYFISWTGGLGTWFIVLCGFWRSVSWEYAEAAYIDGAGENRVLWSIMMPQALPLMGVMFLMGFMSAWNNANTSMLYLPDYPAVAFGLYEYQHAMKRGMDYPMFYAALVMTAIPSLILYGSFQKKIMTNMNIGGLKG